MLIVYSTVTEQALPHTHTHTQCHKWVTLLQQKRQTLRLAQEACSCLHQEERSVCEGYLIQSHFITRARTTPLSHTPSACSSLLSAVKLPYAHCPITRQMQAGGHAHVGHASQCGMRPEAHWLRLPSLTSTPVRHSCSWC